MSNNEKTKLSDSLPSQSLSPYFLEITTDKTWTQDLDILINENSLRMKLNEGREELLSFVTLSLTSSGNADKVVL